MDLNNIHQTCKILLEKGLLNLAGFDGELDANIINGNANIQLSRITGPSKITMQGLNDLNLKISEECEKNTFEIDSKACEIPIDIQLESQRNGNILKLTPKTTDNETNHLLQINCKNSFVNITKASWQDMLEIKYITT